MPRRAFWQWIPTAQSGTVRATTRAYSTASTINHTKGPAAVSVMEPNEVQWRELGVVAGGGGARFPNLADGTRIQLTGGPASVSRSIIRGSDLKMDFGALMPDPMPTTYTATVINRGGRPAKISVVPPGGRIYQLIGAIEAGETKAFGNLADGTRIQVSGFASAMRTTIDMSDRTIEYGLPSPPGRLTFTATIINRGKRQATVSVMGPGLNDFQVVGTLAGGETKQFDKLADGTRVQVSAELAGLLRSTIQGADRTIEFGESSGPPPKNYTVTVVNQTKEPATVSVLLPGSSDFQAIGLVAKGETKAFGNQPEGTAIQVTGFGARSASVINGSDRTITFGAPNPLPPPPPVPVGGIYRVTITLDQLEVVNGGDGLEDPGDLYWQVQLVQRTTVGPIAHSVSQLDRRNSLQAVSGRTYAWNKIDAKGGAVSFDAAAGTPLDVIGTFDEYDDFLRGGDDHMGDFVDNLRVPENGQPGQQTYKKRMLEDVPNGGDITLTYTVRFEPK